MKYFAITCMSLLLIVGCNNNKKANPDNDMVIIDEYATDVYEDPYQDSYEDLDEDIYNEGRGWSSDTDSLGYYGVYEGANLIGGKTLKTTLTLYDDNRYLIHSVDVGENAKTEEERGQYMIMGDLLTLIPDNNGSQRYYKTGDNHMTQLDENKQEIPTLHSQNFKLTRK
ncbi:MAG: copper resistance protein NlpE [Tannerellaceae bacterium]|nr:copper resistance protein NlpE [Tannerellaceae bacterium]